MKGTKKKENKKRTALSIPIIQILTQNIYLLSLTYLPLSLHTYSFFHTLSNILYHVRFSFCTLYQWMDFRGLAFIEAFPFFFFYYRPSFFLFPMYNIPGPFVCMRERECVCA
ncbi:hypothetical protein BDV25DRAFT_163120 [Aspergillus avenaceus]|uniref:Uncharacterized protein n=1 Tax=Aspergillus avenaceus TaxID=36643 RepID=A0A5N6TJ64_ASPAV|nr:hypothetical protein BDV25DRAFT_163120 [Aspergillus avenaceus]